MSSLDFTLRQLQYFVAAVDTGSLTAAARRCHVSHGAVSQGIVELETYLGHALLTRKRSQGVGPTGAGMSLLPYARRITSQAEEMRDFSIDLKEDLVGRMAIGCYTALSPFVAPFIAANFIQPFPQMDVSVTEGSSDELQRQMLAGELDCVIMQEMQRIPGVRVERLGRRYPHVILHPDHRLAHESIVSLLELQDEPMVLLDVPAVRQNLLPMLNRAGVHPNIVWRTQVLETVRAMVARGLGWSVLVQQPPTNISYEGLPLVLRPIKEPLGRNDICLALPEHNPSTYRVRVLTEKLRQHTQSWG